MDIDLTMIFHTHGTAEDAHKLRPYIEECDLFIPEIADWRWRFKLAIYQLARGEISLDEFRVRFIRPEAQAEDSFHGVFYRTLFETRKETFIMELPHSKVSVTMRRELEEKREVRKLYSEGNPEKSLLAIRKLFGESCEQVRKREAHLTGNFRSRVEAKIKRSGQLSGKSAIKVLFVIGLGHEAIYDQIVPQINGRCRKIVLDGHTEIAGYDSLKFAQNLRRRVISDDYSPTDEDLIAYLFPKITAPSPSH